MADLEQAIAEKCARFLTPNKTVVTATEIETIITERGCAVDRASKGNVQRRTTSSGGVHFKAWVAAHP